MQLSCPARLLAAALVVAALPACNDYLAIAGVGNQDSRFSSTALVSNRVALPAAQQDPLLVNPWGLAFGQGAAWVADNGSRRLSTYDGNGIPQNIVVTVPDGGNGATGVTGLVYNPDPGAFAVTANGVTGPGQFIAAGENGSLTAWSAAAGFGNTAVVVYDDGAGNAVYKGLALMQVGGSAFLYAADFRNNKIDTFDSHFIRIAPAGNFRDPGLPSGYAPFNIQAVNGKLIVTYALQQGAGSADEVPGAGFGYISEFDGSGHFLKRLVSGGELNAPWGLALAPAGFGAFGNSLLVGNFGDGRIHAYDPDSGALLGTLLDAQGDPLSLPGLWALAFGNGVAGQSAGSLFYTAGPNNEADGIYGRIDPLPADGGGSGSGSGSVY